jgi:hypothetical protein
MSKALTFTLFCLTIADVIVLYFGMLMIGFAGEGTSRDTPNSLLFWLVVLIPLLAFLAPALAWLTPWPITTPRRRAFACALPILYATGFMSALSILA